MKMPDKNKQFNVMSIRGKITDIESYGEGNKKKFKHFMACPGKDEFSSAVGIIVTSHRMMAAEGDVVEATVEYGGFIKSNKWIDKSTGEQRQMKNLSAYFNEVVQ